MLYKRFLRQLIFALSTRDPELAHDWLIRLSRLFNGYVTKKILRSFYFPGESYGKTVHFPCGRRIEFAHIIGCAAGFDKNAVLTPLLAQIFGFVTFGTVTRDHQTGNQRPRIKRYVAEQSLINWMGFPGQGISDVLQTVSLLEKQPCPIFGNLGKSHATVTHLSYREYEELLESLWPYVDAFEVNISSPNTEGLRRLQYRGQIEELVRAIKQKREKLSQQYSNIKPILLKISDMPEDDLYHLADIVAENLDGVVAFNTDSYHYGLGEDQDLRGGYSGPAMVEKNVTKVAEIRRRMGPSPVIIGCGGIQNPNSAQMYLQAGANLLQVFTGMIYEGPGLVKTIVKSL